MYRKVSVTNTKKELEDYRNIYIKELKDIAKRYGVEVNGATTMASHILRKTTNSSTISRVLKCLEVICSYGVLLKKGLYIPEEM